MTLAKALIQHLKRTLLEFRDPDVVDIRLVAQVIEATAKPCLIGERLGRGAFAKVLDSRHINIQSVEKCPGRGAVRARMRRIRRKQGMQRIQRDVIGTELGSLQREFAQIGEVTDSQLLSERSV